MVAGCDAATFGEAKNSWLTGTAAWTFVDVSQYILGINVKMVCRLVKQKHICISVD